MTMDSAERSAARQRLSALADGELETAGVEQACRQWRGDAELRASWHAYQLIGDVLRSDDLASAPGHDADFLAGLRSRLAAEPVPLAPPGSPAPDGPHGRSSVELPVAAAAQGALRTSAHRRGWMTSAAVAAGFVAVVGVVSSTGTSGGFFGGTATSTATTADGGLTTLPGAAPTGALAVAGRADPLAATTATTTTTAEPIVARGQLIRDVRLDRYLAAHKDFAGSSALGVPSGFLRNATAEAIER